MNTDKKCLHFQNVETRAKVGEKMAENLRKNATKNQSKKSRGFGHFGLWSFDRLLPL